MSGVSGMGARGVYVARNVQNGVAASIAVGATGTIPYIVTEARPGDIAVLNPAAGEALPQFCSLKFAYVPSEGLVNVPWVNAGAGEQGVAAGAFAADIALIRSEELNDVQPKPGSVYMGGDHLFVTPVLTNVALITLNPGDNTVTLPCPGVRLGDVVFLEMEIPNTVSNNGDFRYRGVRVSAADEITLYASVGDPEATIALDPGELSYRLAVIRSGQFEGEQGWDGGVAQGPPNGCLLPMSISWDAADSGDPLTIVTALTSQQKTPLAPPNDVRWLTSGNVQVHSWELPETVELCWCYFSESVEGTESHYIRCNSTFAATVQGTQGAPTSAQVCNGTEYLTDGWGPPTPAA